LSWMAASFWKKGFPEFDLDLSPGALNELSGSG
jgi:hypothetical protein